MTSVLSPAILFGIARLDVLLFVEDRLAARIAPRGVGELVEIHADGVPAAASVGHAEAVECRAAGAHRGRQVERCFVAIERKRDAPDAVVSLRVVIERE